MVCWPKRDLKQQVIDSQHEYVSQRIQLGYGLICCQNPKAICLFNNYQNPHIGLTIGVRTIMVGRTKMEAPGNTSSSKQYISLSGRVTEMCSSIRMSGHRGADSYHTPV